MKFVPNSVSATIARQILKTQKHSPVIMFSAGMVGAVTATVLACKSTLKLEEVLAKAEDKQNEIKLAGETNPTLSGGGVYTAEDAKDDLRLLRIKTAGNVIKLYAPALVVGVASAALLTGAHVVLTKRNVALSAAYAALDRGFKEYRARVRNELGDDKDREFRYGAIDKEIVEEGEHGHEVKTIKRIDPTTGLSIYAKVFDDNNKNHRRSPGANRLFIQTQQNFANDRLNSHGHIFLNEVYDMLGLDREPFGQVVGWVKNNGDGYVDFGLNEDTREVYDFMNGDEQAVWLDFNVDGEVWKLI